MSALSGDLLFSRSYCGRTLLWHVISDGFNPSLAPDIVFDDASFSPLTDSNSSQDLERLLDSWDAERLQQLLDLLLHLYTQHQKAKVAALQDERIQFELSMLDALAGAEVLLAPAADGTDAQQACFSIPVQADLSPANKLFMYLKQQRQQGLQPTGEQQPPRQEDEFVLHAAFRVSPGGAVSHSPSLVLKSPAWCSELLPALTLPSWSPQTSLLEYVPHLAERLEQHLMDHCPAVQLRFELISGLAELFGPPWEVNMMATTSSSASGSGSGSTSTGAAGAAAATATTKRSRSNSIAVFQLMFDQQPILLRLELSQAFPGDAPVLVLQNIRRSGPESSVSLQNMPWSPRWPVDEMVARVFNFLKQEAAGLAATEQLG